MKHVLLYRTGFAPIAVAIPGDSRVLFHLIFKNTWLADGTGRLLRGIEVHMRLYRLARCGTRPTRQRASKTETSVADHSCAYNLNLEESVPACLFGFLHLVVDASKRPYCHGRNSSLFRNSAYRESPPGTTYTAEA